SKCKKAFQSLLQSIFCLNLTVDVTFRNCHCSISGFDHLGKCVLFVGCITLDGIDQIGNQIVPFFECDINICPCVLDHIPVFCEFVEDTNQQSAQNNDTAQ